MILKLKQHEIPKDNPFKHDALKRKENAEILTEFIKSTKEPLVLALNSAWGTGKTTFIKMWQSYLHQNNLTTLYFNAWENDYCESPIVAFIAEIEESIKLSEDNEETKKLRHVFDNVKKVAIQIMKSSIPAAVKLGTMGLIDVSNKDIEKILSDCAEKVASDQIKNYQNSKKSIKEFKKLLSEFVSAVTDNNSERPPIVFFIDELDRCRPTFAIELLENVKHLFSIEGIVFVLSIDKNQLGHSIRSIYGNGMDVDGYLRRFIDIEYILPEPKEGVFVEYLFGRYEFDSYFTAKNMSSDIFSNLQKPCADLFSLYNLSLREQEQIFTQISIVLKTTPKNEIHPIMLVFLLCIRVKNKGLYHQCQSKRFTDNTSVISYLKQDPRLEKNFDIRYDLLLEIYFIYSLREKYSYLNSEPLSNPDLSGVVRSKSEIVKKLIKHLEISHKNVLDYLINKIELLDRFVTQ